MDMKTKVTTQKLKKINLTKSTAAKSQTSILNYFNKNTNNYFVNIFILLVSVRKNENGCFITETSRIKIFAK